MFANEVLERLLPKVAHGRYEARRVVMKMGIEAGEYAVLPRLVASGMVCKVVDFVFMELHSHFAPSKLGDGDKESILKGRRLVHCFPRSRITH